MTQSASWSDAASRAVRARRSLSRHLGQLPQEHVSVANVGLEDPPRRHRWEPSAAASTRSTPAFRWICELGVDHIGGVTGNEDHDDLHVPAVLPTRDRVVDFHLREPRSEIVEDVRTARGRRSQGARLRRLQPPRPALIAIATPPKVRGPRLNALAAIAQARVPSEAPALDAPLERASSTTRAWKTPWTRPCSRASFARRTGQAACLPCARLTPFRSYWSRDAEREVKDVGRVPVAERLERRRIEPCATRIDDDARITAMGSLCVRSVRARRVVDGSRGGRRAPSCALRRPCRRRGGERSAD